jgi:hypothetical protein
MISADSCPCGFGWWLSQKSSTSKANHFSKFAGKACPPQVAAVSGDETVATQRLTQAFRRDLKGRYRPSQADATVCLYEWDAQYRDEPAILIDRAGQIRDVGQKRVFDLGKASFHSFLDRAAKR